MESRIDPVFAPADAAPRGIPVRGSSDGVSASPRPSRGPRATRRLPGLLTRRLRPRLVPASAWRALES